MNPHVTPARRCRIFRTLRGIGMQLIPYQPPPFDDTDDAGPTKEQFDRQWATLNGYDYQRITDVELPAG